MAAFKTEVRFRDIRGRSGKMSFFQSDNSSALPVALAGMSTASCLGAGWLERPADLATNPTNVDYVPVEQKANCLFKSATTNAVKLVIPAPLVGIFLAADGTKVDPTVGTVAALIAAADAVLADDFGGNTTGFVKGRLGFISRKK